MKKYAFLMMGGVQEQTITLSRTDTAVTVICVVSNYENACQLVQQLWRDGFGAIELCGAFGKEKAMDLIAQTNGEIAIGYSIHEPSQDGLFAAFFSEE